MELVKIEPLAKMSLLIRVSTSSELSARSVGKTAEVVARGERASGSLEGEASVAEFKS